MIMEYCVCVEYLNFRATCKLCHLAAPLIGWRNESSLRKRRWHNYSLNSAWLMVVDEGIVTLIDPLSGDNYYMRNSQLSLSLGDATIYCSRYGWLLCESSEFECPVFFNPFTNDVRKLPVFNNGDVKSLCFSAPPTSSDWIVAGYAIINDMITLIYFVSGKPSWCLIDDYDVLRKYPLFSSTFVGNDLCALYKKRVEPTLWRAPTDRDYPYVEGRSIASSLHSGSFYPIETVVFAKVPESNCSSTKQYYMMNCDEYLLVVVVNEFGEVEVFRQNESQFEWKKTDGIGRHTIYIGSTTSVCVDAKTREMENKIYFPHLVWYSLKTRTYHTFDGKLVEKGVGSLLGAKTHAWIEPSWSLSDEVQVAI
ncbi:F-box/kelch-repeat protein At1g57790-like [Rutidosis leptorrhynchoides]|uniref:F-box/kelch-repeat protein At1g57790-like n=1 Tax=Rutidosis leptorrhynchoides TaxID=125765 RepID=UPI003A994533